MEGDDEDRISKLSDDLIFHIFSFMEAKFAVQTCVLSKRWVNLWTTLPYLNFSNINSQSLLSPWNLNFLVQFINNRNHQSPITTFEIDVFEVVDCDYVLEYAIYHNVQQLRISNGFFNFGFVSPVLKTLHLSHCKALLMNWEMPLLESLYLDHVTVLSRDESIMSLKGYKNLKALTLIVDTESYSYLKAFVIDCPHLQNLTMLLVGYYNYMDSKCNFVISAPNMSYFKLGCRDSDHLSVLKVPKSAESGFHCLEDVQFDIDIEWKSHRLERRKQLIQEVIGLFHEFRATKYLSLSYATIQALSRVRDFEAYKPTPFRNLESLKLINLMPLRNDTLADSFDHVIKYLLSNSPCAKIFVKQGCSDGKFQEYVPNERGYVCGHPR